MPDWNALLRERLKSLSLPPSLRDEIVAELASHLEEAYEDFSRRGLSAWEAERLAFADLGDVEKLAKEIYRIKREGQKMSGISKTTRTTWLPGLAGLALLNLIWMALTRADIPPRLFELGFATVPVYLPLLISMPCIGALVAWLSLRAGGDCRARLIAALFSIAALPLVACAGVANGILIGKPIQSTPHLQPTAPAVMFLFLCGLVIQVLTLLAGTVPFLNARLREHAEE